MHPHHQHPTMYSQNDEEQHIVAALEHIPEGKLLEIGAFDGKMFSNTLALLEKGWSGVLVEPSPNVFPALFNLHKDNAKVTLVQAAIGETTAWATFWDSGGDAVSSIDTTHVARWAAGGVPFRPFRLPLISVADFFVEFGTDYDFFNLDVESINMQLFRLLPIPLLERLKCICVEHDYQSHEVIQTLMPYGFEVRCLNGENVVMAKKP